MVSQWKRCFTVLAVCLSFGVAACGPPDDDTDTGVDAGDTGVAPDGDVMEGDTSTPDADTGGPECLKNDDCSEPTPICKKDAEECVECMQNTDCGPGETCTEDNTCKAQGAQCAAVGDACDPDGGPAGSGFKCADLGTGGECVQTCDPEASNPCASGQLCLPASNTENPEYVCYTSQCTGPADLENCTNVDNHPLFPDTSNFKCVSLANAANLCMPAGSRAAGESCTTASPVEGLFCEPGAPCNACQAGNACIGGTCKQICRANASSGELACSSDSDSCVGANASNIVAGGAGFCGEQCEAYSRGQCSKDGEGCYPLNNDIGYCRSAGDKGFMAECQPATASNPNRNECQEGMQCITFQRGGNGREQISRCMPICNAPAPDDNNTNDNDATCGGTAYGRFAYLGSTPSAVDVYIGGTKKVDDLSSGAVSDADDATDGSQFYSFSPAELNVKIAEGSASDASSPLVEEMPFVTSGDVLTWAVTVDKDGNSVIEAIPVPVGVSAPASGKAKIRGVHLVPDVQDGSGNAVNVDVVAVPQSGSLGSDGVELLADADTGDAGEFTEVASGTYDLFIFKQGATRNAGNELAKLTGITVDADTTSSIYLNGTAATGDDAELGAAMVPYTSAPDAPEYTCWNSAGSQDPAPASGLCVQGCDVPEDYGQDSCYADGNACAPLSGGNHFCVPSGDTQVGESCDPGVFQPCAEGATCREYGDGSGTCHSYCIGGQKDSNPTLSCADSRSCTAADGAFGSCDPKCSPNSDYAGPDCPDNLETCYPESVDSEGTAVGAFCSPSNDKAEGDTCGGSSSNRTVTLQNCKPGMFCTYDTATQSRPFVGQYFHRSGADATCKKPCDPFADNPDCPDGYACGVDLAFATSSEVGVCMKKVDGLDGKSTTTRCPGSVGKLCGDHSHCISSRGTQLCYEFCDWSTKEGCSQDNHTCQPFGTGGPIGGLGICAPPQ